MFNQNHLLSQDEADRERIRTDVSHNFFVEASAGSGKTTALVDRMLALVRSGVPVRQICAITFTKNAAAEFYSRFQKKLSAAAANPDFSPEIRQRFADALNEIDLAFMGTIDAFCNLILHEHPVRARIPGDADLRDSSALAPVYAREYAAIISGEYDSSALAESASQLDSQNSADSLVKRAERFAAVFDRPKRLFSDQMEDVMQLRHTNLHYPVPLGNAFSAHHAREIADLAADLQLLAADFADAEQPDAAGLPSENCAVPLVERVERVERAERLCYNPKTQKAQRMREFIPFLRTVSNPAKWDAAPAEIIKALRILDDYQITAVRTPEENGIRSKSLFAANTVSSGKVTFYKIVLKEFPLFRALQSEIVGTAYAFFASAAEPMAEKLRMRGELTYFDNLLYLRDLLRADTESAENAGALIRYIAERHRYFLIDEFQDTNPLQAEIFFYLAAENPVPDWKKCVPRAGALFIVGDVKQSIYRFRNADAAAFLAVREMFSAFPNCSVLTLRRNFRSARPLCEWFNGCFPHLFTESVSYEEIPVEPVYQPQSTFSGVYTYQIIGDSHLPDADTVLSIIRTLTAHPEYTIQTRDDTAPRRIRYSDFMVITPGKHQFLPYVRALSACGIPARVEGELHFSDSPALMSLAAVLFAAVHPERRDALLRAWTCPLTGLTPEDLLRLMPDGVIGFSSDAAQEMCRKLSDKADDLQSQTQFAEGKHALSERLSAFCEAMTALTKRAGAVPFVQLMSEAISMTHLLDFAGTECMDYLIFAQELMRSQTSSAGGTCGSLLTSADCADYLITLCDAPEEERSLMLDKNADCVHFANLHKVKGLEAPIVILALPSRSAARKPSRRTHAGETWFFEMNMQRTDCFSEEQSLEESEDSEEKMRLRYVAATRAQSALIIADLRKTPKSKKQQELEFSSLSLWVELVKNGAPAKDIRSMLQETNAPENHAENHEAAHVDCLTFPASAKEKHMQICTPSRLQRAAVPRTKGQDVPRLKRENSALIGTMVHRLMECMVSASDFAQFCEAKRDALCQEICREYDADAARYAGMLSAVYDRMHAGGYPQEGVTANEIRRHPDDLLKTLAGAEKIYCELPFSFTENDAVWYGLMDLVYCLNGQWHIVDYKTNADSTALDIHYETQLSAYQSAFRSLTGEDAGVHIYHIEI